MVNLRMEVGQLKKALRARTTSHSISPPVISETNMGNAKATSWKVVYTDPSQMEWGNGGG